jgi:hypothetical protein
VIVVIGNPLTITTIGTLATIIKLKISSALQTAAFFENGSRLSIFDRALSV